MSTAFKYFVYNLLCSLFVYVSVIFHEVCDGEKERRKGRRDEEERRGGERGGERGERGEEREE